MGRKGAKDCGMPVVIKILDDIPASPEFRKYIFTVDKELKRLKTPRKSRPRKSVKVKKRCTHTERVFQYCRIYSMRTQGRRKQREAAGAAI